MDVVPSCPLSVKAEFCEACSLTDVECKALGNYFLATEKGWLDSLNLQDSEKKELLFQMAKRTLQLIEKKRQSIAAVNIINLCSAAEDEVLIEYFRTCLEQESTEEMRNIFNCLYRKHFRYVHKIASLKLPDHPHCTPEEILQRVMISLIRKRFRSLNQWRGKSSFKTFLTTVIYRSINECLRDEYRRKKPPGGVKRGEDENEGQDSVGISHEQDKARQAFGEAVAGAIQEIADRNLQDAQILLWRFQGRRNKEIADVLGVTADDVSQRLTKKDGLLERFTLLIHGRLRGLYGLELQDFNLVEVKNEDFWLKIMPSLRDRLRLKR